MRSPNDPIKSQIICDREGDHYQLVNLGWKDSITRIYGCVLHVDIIIALLQKDANLGK